MDLPFSGFITLNTPAYVKCLLISCFKETVSYDKLVLCEGNITKICSGGEATSILAMSKKSKMKIKDAVLSTANAITFSGLNPTILVITEMNELDKYEFNLAINEFKNLNKINFIVMQPEKLANYLRNFYGRRKENKIQNPTNRSETVPES